MCIFSFLPYVCLSSVSTVCFFVCSGDVARGDDTDAEETEEDCGTGWMHIHRGCYRFSSQAPKGWEEALVECQSEGGELLSVSSVIELVSACRLPSSFFAEIITYIETEE